MNKNPCARWTDKRLLRTYADYDRQHNVTDCFGSGDVTQHMLVCAELERRGYEVIEDEEAGGWLVEHPTKGRVYDMSMGVCI